MAADGTDVEVLSRGFRSRLWLLGVVVVGALGAALWSGTREQGVGEPEDRQRLMIVTRGVGVDYDYYRVLERGGFVVEVDSYADWEAGARELLPESEAEGVGLLLELADERGFGFVVFESPGELDFGGLELEPSPAEIEDFRARDYAVVSVGDLAFPHRLSVDEPGEDPLLRMPGYGAIDALFDQPAVLAREDQERPTVEELQYEDAIEAARFMYERPATFQSAIDYARSSIDERLAKDVEARTLVETFETGSAVPTPDGGVMLVHHGLEIYSDDAQTLELHPAALMRFDYLSPAALESLFAGGELQPVSCPSLAGGAIELERALRIEAAGDGSTIAISSAAGEATVWRKLEQPGCVWHELARVPGLGDASIVLAPRLAVAPESDGQRTIMAMAGVDEQRVATVRVWLGPETAEVGGIDERGFEQDETEDAQALDLLRLPESGAEASFGALAFIDDLRLAVLSRVALPPEQRTTTLWADHALHVVDRRRPGAHLRIPAEFFAGARALRELAVVGPAVAGGPASAGEEAPRDQQGPSFAVTAIGGDAGTELILLTVGAAAWQAFEDAVRETGEGVELHTLTPDDLDVRTIAEHHALEGLVIHAQTGALAYVLADGPLPSELAVAPLAGGATRRLTDNDLVDTLPRFSADGRYLVYVTMMRTSLSALPFSIPRIVPVDLLP